jgi:3-deoxy-D-arabino-heptulosonate 7-phosphate (DAHP) synthase
MSDAKQQLTFSEFGEMMAALQNPYGVKETV